MADQSVACVVTSPPYYSLRDYGEPGQYGLEASPAEYVDTMRQVFAEVRRVLAADGTLWLNIADTYASKANAGTSIGRTRRADRVEAFPNRRNTTGTAPYKSLLLVPERTALALVDDGWILRNRIVWAKPNGLPESVGDRFASRHETVFLFVRSSRYWFDLDVLREPHSPTSLRRAGRNRFTQDRSQEGIGSPNTVEPHHACHPAGRNPGDVWALPTLPFPEAHFAVMPPALAERCVLAGARPGGTVLDPFCGSGTTGMVALKHGRRFVGIDLSATYLDLALRTRLRQGVLIDEDSWAAGTDPSAGVIKEPPVT
jgi:DNA modification methylase